GYCPGEYRPHDEAGSPDLQQWREEWNGYLNRRKGQKDTERIRSIEDEAFGVGEEIRSDGERLERRGLRENLEAREIVLGEIEEIAFYETEEPVYDICVYGNHNYCITEENILVSNSGKTFMIISILVTRAILYPGSRHLIARKFFSHARASVWLDTLPKVVKMMIPDLEPLLRWNNTDYFLAFPNGSEIWVGGLDDKEKVDKIL